MIKPRPDMTDEECTPEAIIKECVIHGSPRTVLDKLVALRDASARSARCCRSGSTGAARTRPGSATACGSWRTR